MPGTGRPPTPPRALVVGGEGDARADALAAALRGAGAAVARATGRPRRPSPPPDLVVTSGAGAHATGRALRRRGTLWVADAASAVPEGADVVSAASRDAQRALADGPRLAALLLPAGGDAAPLLAGLAARRAAAGPPAPGRLRVLLLGPVTHVHVEHLALALRERGVEVIVAGEVWPGVEPGTLLAAGVPVHVKDGPFVPWLRTLLRAVRPDVVHAHWMPFAAKALAAGARPVVAQPWGSDVYRASAPFRAANALVVRTARALVTDSADLLEALPRARGRTAVVNWGVDRRTFHPGDEPRAAVRARLGLGEGPVVLSPRSLTAVYNPRTILEAFAAVRARLPGARLVLKHMAAEPPADLLPLPEGVTVVGHVPYAEMADWYRAADVCVSVPGTDSSPRSVWEAMACGAPCVVSDLPWAREALRPGEDALLVDVEPAAVAGALLRVLGDPALAQRLAAAGQDLVARAYDRDREMRRLVDLYASLAA